VPDAKKRGGNDTAREKGLTGVIAHFTPAERIEIALAAAAQGLTPRNGGVKEFVRRAALEAARKVQKKE
jgi:copper homeostasis protein CutC